MVGWKNHEAHNRRGWTDATEAKLKEAVLAGNSANEIVELLGGLFSRNAIIGKVHRMAQGNGKTPADPLMQLAGSHADGPRQPRPRKPRPSRAANPSTPRSKRAGEAPAGPEAPVSRETSAVLEWKPPRRPPADGVSVLKREAWMCKWPVVGPLPDKLFVLCGQPRYLWDAKAIDETAPPYCYAHCCRAWQGWARAA